MTDNVVYTYEIPIPSIQAQQAYEELVKQSDKSKAAVKRHGYIHNKQKN